MKKLLAAGAAAGLVLLGGGMAPASAAPAYGQICDAGDSGKIEVAEGVKTLTIKAPEGFVITKVCVKAGSAKNGPGAETKDAPNNDGSVPISHSSEKDISHYSFWYEAEGYAPCEPAPDNPYNPSGC